MQKTHKTKPADTRSVVALAATMLLAAAAARAGTGGTEFDAIYGLVEGWMEGTLGRLFAVASVVVGLGAGILRGSVLAAVTGIGFALVMFYAPDIIGGIVTATLPV
ncbi:MAG: TraA family conjugative transfer protein [Pseudomonadota bacterium]